MQLPNAHPQPSAAIGFPAFCPTSVTGSASTWGSLSVAVLPAIAVFFASLSPRYETQRQSFTVVPPAMASPADTGSWKAGDVASKIKLASNVLACWMPSVRVISEAVAALCSTVSLAEELDGVLADKKGKHPSLNLTGPATAALTLVILDNLPSAAAVPPLGMPGSAQNPIPVSDGATLGMIGQAGYPTDAYYMQERSFHHDINVPGPAFAGHYDGGCHTITGLKTCLFSEIQRHGVVRNLRLVNVDIDYDRSLEAALACTMEPYSTARDIQVANARVWSQGGGEYDNLAAVGTLVGHQKKDALISGIDLRNCTVESYSSYSAAGVLGGRIDGLVQDANIIRCRAEGRNKDSPTGIVAGRLEGHIERLAVADSLVHTHQARSHAGIGAGQMERGSIEQFGAGRCAVLTDDEEAMAGIVAGIAVGDLKQMTVAGCRVKTRETRSFAGIGAGQLGAGRGGERNHIDNLVAVDSSVETLGDAYAGIGIGKLNSGRADRMTLVNCSVTARGDRVLTGVGAGFNAGQINNLISVGCQARNGGGTAGLESGDEGGTAQGTASLNSRINDQLQTFNPPDLPGLCCHADPRFVTTDCSPVPYNDTRPVCQSTPLAPACGTVWLPIEVNNEETLNSIGHNASFPPGAFYIQTRDLDGSRLNSDPAMVFDGHYDGQNHVIRNQHGCLFKRLRGTLKNLHLTGARINGSDRLAAVAACSMSGGSLIQNLRITNSQVINRGPAGIVVSQHLGMHNQIADIVVRNATVETHVDYANAGVIAPACGGVTRRVDIHNSQVKTHGNWASAGLGCGLLYDGELDTLDVTCSRVETFGRGAKAGIGAGRVIRGQLSQMTIVNSTVSTSGRAADAGGGAGYLHGRLEYFNALHTRVHTTGIKSSAGTGVGYLFPIGKIMDITSVHCETVTEGSQAHAGVCTGFIDSDENLLRNTRSVNNTVQVHDRRSKASVHGILLDGSEASPDQSITVNTRVNHTLVDDGPVPHNISKNFCEFASAGLVSADCRINSLNLSENCIRPSFPPPLNISTQLTTCTQAPPAPTDAPVPLIPCRPVPPTPTGVPALPGGTVTLLPVSLQPLAITAAVPLATGLSSSAIAGIAVASTVGVIAAAIVAGYCYRRHRSSQPEDEMNMKML